MKRGGLRYYPSHSVKHRRGEPMKPKRETAQERDERIVREAGPWLVNACGAVVPRKTVGSYNELAVQEIAVRALCDHANRLSRRAKR